MNLFHSSNNNKGNSNSESQSDCNSENNSKSQSFCNSKNNLKCNAIKCIVSLLGIFLFGFILKKIYEVPVYYTKIDTAFVNTMSNIGDGLNIKIVRDYDRADKSTILSESDTLPQKGRVQGGIFITGSFHYDENYNSSNTLVSDSIKRTIGNAMNRYGIEKIEKPHSVYISAITSYRQTFSIHYNYEYEDTFSLKNGVFYLSYYLGTNKVCKEYQYKDYFWYRKVNSLPNRNGCKMEDYFTTSNIDSILYVDYLISPYTHAKPNIFLTAEDISKIVEVIEIGHSLREHIKGSGAWAYTDRLEIDYVGPAEFSENITPKPDTITLSSIIYTDRNKIYEIGKHGLRFHVKFPDMENIQEAKIFIVSSIITGLGALFFRYIFFSLRNIWQMLSERIEKKQYLYMTFIILIVIIIISLLYILLNSATVSSFDIENSMFKNLQV